MAMEEVRKRLTIETTTSPVEKAASDINKVADAEARLTVESQKSERAQLSQEAAFAKLERRYVEGVRQQQELAKVQAQVNAAVAQNPALQERASAVLAGAAARINATKVAHESFYDSITQRSTWRHLAREAAIVGGPLGGVIQQFGALTLGASHLSIGITAGVVGFAALASAATTATEKYAALEAQQARVGNALRASGRSPALAGGIEANVQRGAQSGTQLTADIRAASLELLRFRDVSSDVFPQVMQAAKDVAATGFADLKGATESIGKALQDPTKAGEQFATMGLRLSDSAQRAANELFGAGNRAGAAKIILKELSEQVGGSDARAADTLAGAWGRLKNQSTATLETLGEQIAKFIGLKDAIDAAARSLDNYNKGNTNRPQRGAERYELRNRQFGASSFDEAGFTAGGLDAAPASFGDRFRATGSALKGVVPPITMRNGFTNDMSTSFDGGNTWERMAEGAAKVSTAAELTSERTARAAAEAEKLRQAWGGVSTEVANTLQTQQEQIAVASAVTGQQQIAAQYAATYAQSIREGSTAEEALLQASMQRAVTLAQINAEADRQLKTLQQQGELLQAASDFDRDRIKAAQTYQNLLEKGVDSERARAVAGQQLRNDDLARQAKETADAEREAAASASDKARANQAAAASAAREAEEVERIIAANREWARTHDFIVMGGALQTRADGTKTQFTPGGYKSSVGTAAAAFANNVYGPGGFDAAGRPNAQGITNVVNAYLAGQRNMANASWAQGGGVAGAIQGLLSGTTSGGGMSLTGGGLDPGTLQLVQQLTELLPDDRSKAASIEQQLAILRSQPQNVQTLQAMAQLTQSLMQLKQSTDANTEALRITTDPLISQGHDYLNDLKIGYYRAASGFDGVARGGIPGVDSIPFHAMVQEGERITITPPGRAANSNVSTSNDNSKNVTQYITQNIGIMGGARDPRTARQMAQGFIAAAARAAG